VKIVNTSSQPQKIDLSFSALKKRETLTAAKLVTLSSDNLDGENTLDNPFAIVPKYSDFDFAGNHLNITVNPYTFVIYSFKLHK
jgi:alpha-L-arabinofuranosidase